MATKPSTRIPKPAKHVPGSMDSDGSETESKGQLLKQVDDLDDESRDNSLDAAVARKYVRPSARTEMSFSTPFAPLVRPDHEQLSEKERSQQFDLLKKGQKRVYEEARTFLLDKKWGNSKDNTFLINGGAGCGKTFLTRALVSDLRLSWCCAATTNKATKVLQRNLEGLTRCKTIFSVLGMRMAPDEDLMKLKIPKKPVNISNYDVILLDEAGMGNVELIDYIEYQARQQGVKIVYVADEAQLNPVGEGQSKCFQTERRATLKKVLRQDNQILDFAQHVRKQVLQYPDSQIKLRSDNDSIEGVWRLKKRVWLDQIESAAEAGMFTKVDDTKVIAWRNKTVDEINQIIRRRIFGDKEAKAAKWLPGDRVSIRRPVPDPEAPSRIIGYIDDEGTITSVRDIRHSLYREYQAHHITMAVDDGPNLKLQVVAQKSEMRLNEELNRRVRIAVKNPAEWGEFWALKNAFNEISHSYAQTAHRSQGSTYVNVFAEASEILSNPDEQEALRCFYVTSSRPTTRLILT